MTEYSPAVEIPKTGEDRRHIVRRVATATGHIAVESAKEIFAKESTRRVAGGLALLGAVSTAAQLEHWFDHSGALIEFLQGSGRHFFVGYVGAMAGIVKSKAETMQGKVIAGLAGAMGGDVLAEAGQSMVVTGALHHGNLHDVLSFASKKEIFWGNAKDAGAAGLAGAGAVLKSTIE